MAGLVTFPLDAIYHTVKFRLQAFSEGLNYELARFGISVKIVVPGYIRTNFGSYTTVVSAEPCAKLMDKFLSVANNMMDPNTSGQTSEQVAETVYEAVTDGKKQVLYVSGEDTK